MTETPQEISRFYLGHVSEELVADIKRLIAAEREACAKIAEDETDKQGGFDSAAHVLQQSIAAAIRARGK